MAKHSAAIYLLGGVALYMLQDRILFHPEALKRNKSYGFSAAFREMNIAVNETSNMNIVQFLTKDSLPAGVVLYFHGNRKNIAWYAPYADDFTQNGYEVWMIDYPGFGKSTGSLTEQKLYDDAEQLYMMALSKFTAKGIIIYGKSLGTGVAAWLGAKRTCKQLILETPYYSMTSGTALSTRLSRWHYFAKLPVYKYLSFVNAPVTAFHARLTKILYNNAHRLTTVMHPKDSFITIENGDTITSRLPCISQRVDSLLHNTR